MEDQPTGTGPVGTPTTAGWPRPVGRPAAAHWWSIQPPPQGDRISARRAYTEVLVIFAAFFAANIVAGGEALAGRLPVPSGSWVIFLPNSVSELAKCVVAVVVVLLLSARRGISPRALGFGWARKSDGTPGAAQNLRIAAWAIVALLLGGRVTIVLAHGRHILEPLFRDYSYLVYSMTASLNAGIVEETVALAFVVTTLRQARRPLLEIAVVAVLLRCSYHDYYGWGVLGIAIWAGVFVWLYLRSGSILPLIVVHVLWDASQFLGLYWPVAWNIWGALLIVSLLTAAVTWIMNAARRGQQTWPPPASGAGPWPPPGGPGAWPPPGGIPAPLPPWGGAGEPSPPGGNVSPLQPPD
ncbi:MAG TPA: CPBP family intramembrane glutamic endopeptidase [Streptosporangiaceae bacterium]